MAKMLILKGIVQGVFCRDYCSKTAKILGLSGAASNLSDGTVKVILDTKSDQKTHSFIEAIKKNSFDLKFYGQIDSIDTRNYSGQIYGDYQF